MFEALRTARAPHNPSAERHPKTNQAAKTDQEQRHRLKIHGMSDEVGEAWIRNEWGVPMFGQESRPDREDAA
jgi:hypothetical protein